MTQCCRVNHYVLSWLNDKQAGTVGFALTILQSRLASSPETIYQSLRRRRERLESRLRQLELLQRGVGPTAFLDHEGPAFPLTERRCCL
jgi:hypothetical protein